jgi:predicted transcriptional regulator
MTNAEMVRLKPPSSKEEPPSSIPVAVVTVGPESKPTVGLEPQPGGFYLAEDLGALFPVTRVKPIRRAQDALTSKEEAVYEVLWRNRDIQGLSNWAYSALASHKDVRSDKRNVARILRRLVQKGFIEVVHRGGGAHTQKTVYRALDYAAVLQAQSRRGACGAIKTGNGIFYAIKVTLPG